MEAVIAVFVAWLLASMAFGILFGGGCAVGDMRRPWDGWSPIAVMGACVIASAALVAWAL